MPSPDSAEGKAYVAIFDNCVRGGLGPHVDQWCGCYIGTLHSLNAPSDLVDALAHNPFVDGSTYMSWPVSHITDGAKLYDCAQVLKGDAGVRDSYRAAWGEFTLTKDQCEPEIVPHALRGLAWGRESPRG